MLFKSGGICSEYIFYLIVEWYVWHENNSRESRYWNWNVLLLQPPNLLNDSEIICIPDDGVVDRFYPLKLGYVIH